MEKICEKKECTACGICSLVCPAHCIKLKEEKTGAIYPEVDKEKCINCQKCVKYCPNNKEMLFSYPIKAYAAWSKDTLIRSFAASGGIASELYQYAIKNNWYAVGALLSKEKHVCFYEVNKNNIESIRNSKYVFSELLDIPEKIKAAIKKGKNVLFIGLPCQNAAIKSFLREPQMLQRVIFVDLVCHGVPSQAYFRDYIDTIEKRYRRKAEEITFRGAHSSYLISIKDKEKKEFYKKDINSNDIYYAAFAENLNFRENCYCCKYARKERITDLTLGDYSGLEKEISLVLINTRRGNEFLDNIKKDNKLQLVEKPVQEALSAPGNKQLREPSSRNPNRDIFLQVYIYTSDYKKAVKKAMGKQLFLRQVAGVYSQCIGWVSSKLNPCQKKKIKQIFRLIK